MTEGMSFSFPSLLFHEGRTYGQPEVVLISLPQVAAGLRFADRARSVGGHSMQAAMRRALLRRGRSGVYKSLLWKVTAAGNPCRTRQKGGNIR